MDLSGVSKDMAEQLTKTVNYILNMNISSQQKRILLERLFQNVGIPFYEKMFADSSELFASTAIKSAGIADLNNQASRLATKMVRNYALSRGIEWLGKDFLDSLLGKAEYEAFQNGRSLGKAPTLTRRLTGKENCKWCAAKAGTYINPFGEDFARHRDCDCVFIVKGFNSRNGVLRNYNKKSGQKEIKKDFKSDVFGDNKPGVGNITVEKSKFDREADINLAKYLKKTFGGKYTVLSDINPNGVKSPDILLDGKAVFEQKTVSSITSVDSNVRKAILQLQNSNLSKRKLSNPESLKHIIVLEVNNDTQLNIDQIEEAIYHRLNRSKRGHDVDVDYILVRKNNKEWVFRWIK